ncbi:MAG: hypothetical protein M1837_002783 [Sclerophora amabilis]|nr:MAG: hypothetical protein M1837_002783 [Sclerophora amabilis]
MPSANEHITIGEGNRSPSPPGSPPTQESPGHRATALSNIFNSALSHTLRSCSYENFAACFPTPARYCPDSLRELWRQMVGKMDVLAKERSAITSLNKLDLLIADATRRKALAPTDASPPIPPHTLPPASILSAHLLPHLRYAQSTLNAQLQTTQSQNAQIISRIGEQRAEIGRLVEGLEMVVGDLEGAVHEFDRMDPEKSGRGGAIGDELDGMERELSTSAAGG